MRPKNNSIVPLKKDCIRTCKDNDHNRLATINTICMEIYILVLRRDGYTWQFILSAIFLSDGTISRQNLPFCIVA